jgi:hypothetical protein
MLELLDNTNTGGTVRYHLDQQKEHVFSGIRYSPIILSITSDECMLPLNGE